MHATHSFRRTLVAASGGALLALTIAGSALGHSQIVQPPSHDEPVVSGPISKAWAQAHCNANSPAIVADRSNGVVRFLPGAALPCPLIANPGGQVHGD
jgi:hypothetical protein